MHRGTTPTLVFVTDIDLSHMKTVWATFTQNNVEITKEAPDMKISDSSLSVTLTQEETLRFHYHTGSYCELQVRAMTASGNAIASDIVSIPIDRILKGGVIK